MRSTECLGVHRRRLIGVLLLQALFYMPTLAAAQQTPTLTLEQAIALARQNNPDFLSQKNDVGVADWSIRAAYGDLMPGASVSTGLGYQASGEQRFGTLTGSDLGIGKSPAYYSSDYSLNLNYSVSGAALMAPARAKQNRIATVAGIDASEFVLGANVTRQYLAVLRAQDGVQLTEAELGRAEENRKLAEARVAVGDAIPLDLKQAEVEKGRAEVNVLQARNLVRTEKLRLAQQLGIEFEGDPVLSSRFTVFTLPHTREQLLEMAMRQHPQLLAARANETANEASVKMARSAYLPSLSVSAGWSGFTREASSTNSLVSQAQGRIASERESCLQMNALSERLTSPLPGFPQNCDEFVFTPDMERAVIASNDVFPFNFTGQPWNARLTVSLPIFNGFQREQQIEVARVNATDASLRLRSEELRIKTEIGTAFLNLQTSRESVALEERNRELANDQLTLARERYRVGATTFLELQDAETSKARADRAYLIALYSFHESVAALETAAGVNLRPAGEGR